MTEKRSWIRKNSVVHHVDVVRGFSEFLRIQLHDLIL